MHLGDIHAHYNTVAAADFLLQNTCRRISSVCLIAEVTEEITELFG